MLLMLMLLAYSVGHTDVGSPVKCTNYYNNFLSMHYKVPTDLQE